jgi:hypothetical protein
VSRPRPKPVVLNADVFNAWVPQELNRLVKSRINAGVV